MKKEENIFEQLRILSEEEILTPPVSAWNKLEGKLSIQKKKRKKLNTYTGIIIAILLILLSISLIAIMITNIHKNEQKAIQSMKLLHQLEGTWVNQISNKELVEWHGSGFNSLVGNKILLLDSDTLITKNIYTIQRDKNKIYLHLLLNENQSFTFTEQKGDTLYFQNKLQLMYFFIQKNKYSLHFEGGQHKDFLKKK